MSAEAPPPGWLRTVVRWILPGEYGDEFVADIEEELQGRLREGFGSRLRATAWCLGQLVRPDTVRLAVHQRAHARKAYRSRGAMAGKPQELAALLEGLADDLGAAIRSLLRSPGYTLLAGATLAIGIGATTAIFSAADATLLRPFPYDETARMYRFNRPVGRLRYPATEEQIEAWSRQDDLFESFLRTNVDRRTLTGVGPAGPATIGRTQRRTLDVLGIRPAFGRAFLPDEEDGEGARVVLVAHRLWRNRFGGDPGVLGRTISLDGEPYEVIGVMPPHTPFPYSFEYDVDLWAPLPEQELDRSDATAIAREGVTTGDIQARVDLIRDRAIAGGEDGERWQAAAHSVADDVSGSAAEPIRILAAASALVLLVAFVNVANLLLGRTVLRRTEMSVRSAIGASRGRLIRQMLIESLILAALGTGLGLIVAYGTVGLASALRPPEMVLLDEIRLDARVLAFAALLGALGAVAVGTLPAWIGTRAATLAGLRHSTSLERRSTAARRARWLLVGGEVALSFALLVGSVAALRALDALQRRDLGFPAEEVIVLRPQLLYWEYDSEDAMNAVQERFGFLIESTPGVVDVSVGGHVPLVGGGSLQTANFQVEGEEPLGVDHTLFTHDVDADLYEVMGIPMLAGRTFDRVEVRDEAPVVVIDQPTAQLLFGDAAEAIGRRFRTSSATPWQTVVGVVPELDPEGTRASFDEFTVYHPQAGGAGYVVRISGEADPSTVLRELTDRLRAEAPNVIINTDGTVKESLAGRTAREQFTSSLLSGFSFFAFLLAIVGLYAVVVSLVGQRTREIGIRVSLGATGRQIRRLVVGEGVAVTSLGILAGALLAWWGLGVLSSQMLGLESRHAATSYLAAGAVLALASLTACWVPAQRATRIDPVEALREE